MVRRRVGRTVIFVSGNIEAHQSVLGFKTVQSRIVELPFDEGQYFVLIARLDDSDYRQQVTINTAAVEVDQRRLPHRTKTLSATQQTVASDAAEFRQQEYDRAAKLLKTGSRHRATAATRLTRRFAAIERRCTSATVALQNAADRQVVFKPNIHSAKQETLEISQIVLGYTFVLRAGSRASSKCARRNSARSWCRARR